MLLPRSVAKVRDDGRDSWSRGSRASLERVRPRSFARAAHHESWLVKECRDIWGETDPAPHLSGSIQKDESTLDLAPPAPLGT